MTTQLARNARREAIRWTNREVRPNVALTLTLNQGRSHRSDRGTFWERGNPDVYARVYAQFVRRLSRRIFGAKLYRRFRKLIPNGAALEGNGITKRYHLHIFLRRPDFWTFEDFNIVCRAEWLRSPWALEDMKVEPITGNWVGYSQKEGTEALLIGSLSF